MRKNLNDDAWEYKLWMEQTAQTHTLHDDMSSEANVDDWQASQVINLMPPHSTQRFNIQ